MANEAQTKLRTGVVALLDPSGQIVGAGFVAAERLIVSCAHVVIAAGSGPGGTVRVRFHHGGEARDAWVDAVAWSPPQGGGNDVAILRLDADLPEGVAPLALAPSERCAGHSFRSLGYPAIGGFVGLWAAGEILGSVDDVHDRRMLHLRSPEIAGGMSGGPVWDEVQRRVVGAVMATNHPDKSAKHRDTSFAIPSETLWQVSPELAVHKGQPESVHNPFRAGGRINAPERFFGRHRLVREIRAELGKRCSVSLVGASQIGKSSLLYYLYATRADWLPNPAVTLEYVDLQGMLDEGDFCETVLSRLGQAGDTLRDLKRALRDGKREVVLLFDEVERLAEADFNPRLHDLLRSLSQEPHFAMCVATQRPLVEVFPARAPGGVSPFHNVFTVKTLGPFREDEARDLLAARLAGTGVSFGEREVERLLAQSGCRPAELQRLAGVLFLAKVG